MRNQDDAQATFQAWEKRGPDALLVDVPDDVSAIELDMIWEVLHEASLNIFQNLVIIAL